MRYQLAKALNKAGLLAVRVGGTGGSSQTSARLTGLAGMRGVAFWFVLRLLIDTSVWLDMATRREGQKWIVPLRVLKFQGKLELLVPALVIEEFDRNRPLPAAAASVNLTDGPRV